MDSTELRQQYNWQQDTPVVQLAAIYQSLSGWSHNYFVDGFSSKETAGNHIIQDLEQLEALLPFVRIGHW